MRLALRVEEPQFKSKTREALREHITWPLIRPRRARCMIRFLTIMSSIVRMTAPACSILTAISCMKSQAHKPSKDCAYRDVACGLRKKRSLSSTTMCQQQIVRCQSATQKVRRKLNNLHKTPKTLALNITTNMTRVRALFISLALNKDLRCQA